jgi:hypothetical protein
MMGEINDKKVVSDLNRKGKKVLIVDNEFYIMEERH